MNSRVVAAIAAAILAVIGIAAVVIYAASANNRAFGGASLVEVYRATDDISANSTADEVEKKAELVKLPNSAVAKGAIKDLSDIKELKTTVTLLAGEQLVIGRFAKAGSSAAGGAEVPKGLQEISLLLPNDAGVSQVIKTGQNVGVIALVEDGEGKARQARMIGQGIRVTAVEAVDNVTQVTLATNGTLATNIAAAAQYGQIRLTVQNDDTEKDGGKTVEAEKIVK